MKKQKDVTTAMNDKALEKWNHMRKYEKELDQEDLDAWDEAMDGGDDDWDEHMDSQEEEKDQFAGSQSMNSKNGQLDI